MLPTYSSFSELPEHLTTRAGLKAMGLDHRALVPVATVQAFGRALDLFVIAQALPVPHNPGFRGRQNPSLPVPTGSAGKENTDHAENHPHDQRDWRLSGLYTR